MKTLLIGERYRKELESALLQNGFEPLWITDNPALDPRLAGHTDLSVFRYQNTLILARHLYKSKALVNYLTSRGYQCIQAAQQASSYPRDATLCARVIGDRIIHNPKITDASIIQRWSEKIIAVRQGYSSCAVLPVDTESVITADHGIAAAAVSAGLQVLEIKPGWIQLNGYKEGFIGGCAFADEDTIWFTGTLVHHPSFAVIMEFLRSRGKRVVFLTDTPAFDIGGAVII